MERQDRWVEDDFYYFMHNVEGAEPDPDLEYEIWRDAQFDEQIAAKRRRLPHDIRFRNTPTCRIYG